MFATSCPFYSSYLGVSALSIPFTLDSTVTILATTTQLLVCVLWGPERNETPLRLKVSILTIAYTVKNWSVAVHMCFIFIQQVGLHGITIYNIHLKSINTYNSYNKNIKNNMHSTCLIGLGDSTTTQFPWFHRLNAPKWSVWFLPPRSLAPQVWPWFSTPSKLGQKPL